MLCPQSVVHREDKAAEEVLKKLGVRCGERPLPGTQPPGNGETHSARLGASR